MIRNHAAVAAPEIRLTSVRTQRYSRSFKPINVRRVKRLVPVIAEGYGNPFPPGIAFRQHQQRKEEDQ